MALGGPGTGFGGAGVVKLPFRVTFWGALAPWPRRPPSGGSLALRLDRNPSPDRRHTGAIATATDDTINAKAFRCMQSCNLVQRNCCDHDKRPDRRRPGYTIYQIGLRS